MIWAEYVSSWVKSWKIVQRWVDFFLVRALIGQDEKRVADYWARLARDKLYSGWVDNYYERVDVDDERERKKNKLGWLFFFVNFFFKLTWTQKKNGKKNKLMWFFFF